MGWQKTITRGLHDVPEEYVADLLEEGFKQFLHRRVCKALDSLSDSSIDYIWFLMFVQRINGHYSLNNVSSLYYHICHRETADESGKEYLELVFKLVPRSDKNLFEYALNPELFSVRFMCPISRRGYRMFVRKPDEIV